MIKARTLATKRAEEYAAQDRAAHKSLQEFFGTEGKLKVSETNSFSWLTIGNVPFDPSASQPRISQVEGVEHAGEAFMQAVFDLAPGEVGVALNQPQDTAYVVRLVDYEKSLDELRQEFAAEHQLRYLVVGRPEHVRMYRPGWPT